MYTARLKHLAKILRHVPKDNFDLLGWSAGGVTEQPDLEKHIECGTICCAVGWACLDPEFNKQGLKWDQETEVPTFDMRTGWSAAKAFFGLSSEEAHHLFDADEYRVRNSPNAVTQRIYKLIRNDGLPA